jgi:hypothetical protein
MAHSAAASMSRQAKATRPPLAARLTLQFRYDRQRCEVKQIKDIQLLAAMAPPGGGRNPLSARVQACFSTLNFASPSDAQLRRIFSTLLNAKLADFDEEVGGCKLVSCWLYQSAATCLWAAADEPPCTLQVKPLGDSIVAATVNIYRALSEQLLPTPSKSHYLFNTRDLAKIVQGLSQVGGKACCGQASTPGRSTRLRHLVSGKKSLYMDRKSCAASCSIWEQAECRPSRRKEHLCVKLLPQPLSPSPAPFPSPLPAGLQVPVRQPRAAAGAVVPRDVPGGGRPHVGPSRRGLAQDAAGRQAGDQPGVELGGAVRGARRRREPAAPLGCSPGVSWKSPHPARSSIRP